MTGTKTAISDDVVHQAGDASLPLRKDVPGLPECPPPEKDIHKTRGGKLVDFFIYKVLGFGANSTASVGVTYWVNPKPEVKQFRDKAKASVQRLFKGTIPPEAVGNGVEIGFMLISGTVVTAIMAPLVKSRDKMAYWINQKLGVDTDVLPEAMKHHEPPKTLEEKVEQELKKRVEYNQTSGDLWKARWSGLLVPLFGDMYLGKLSSQREAEGKWSVDTVSWEIGQKMYDNVLSKKRVQQLGRFFERHGAGIDDMEKQNPDMYARLAQMEEKRDKYHQALGHGSATESVRKDRMMIADQTRLLGKEVGWTLALAEIVERLTAGFQARRVRRQEDKALAELRKAGIIPKGINVETDEMGHVTLTQTKEYVAPGTAAPTPTPDVPVPGNNRQWAQGAASTKTHAEMVARSKEVAGAAMQHY